MSSKLLFFVLVTFSLSFSMISEAQWKDLKVAYKTAQTTSDLRVKFNLAMAYASTGFLQEGFNELASINKIDPSFAKKILGQTTEELEVASGDWKANFNHAFALYFNDKKEESKEYFYKVVSLSPESSAKGWALGYVAYIHGEKKDWKKGLQIIEEAIRYEPDGVALFLAKGYGQQQVGDYFGLTGTLVKVGSMQASSVFNKYSIDNLKNDK